MTTTTDPAITVVRATTVILHTGHGGILPPGVYPIVEIDGAAERGALYVTGPDGNLVCVDPHSMNIIVPAGDVGAPFRSDLGPRPGYVAGTCGHAVAGSEWLAGLRTCERCD